MRERGRGRGGRHPYKLGLFCFQWEGSSTYHHFQEDWPGEAALVESEMKRFREWARGLIRSMLNADGSIEGLNLVVFPRHRFHPYFVMRTENIRPVPFNRDGGRIIYSLEEGA